METEKTNIIPKYLVLENVWNLDTSQFLTEEDIVRLSIYWESFAKLTKHKALSIQFEIWEWKWKWREEIAYSLVEILVSFSQDIKDCKKVFDSYKEKQTENIENNEENLKK